MNQGEIYRTREPIVESAHKPGFYVIVSGSSVVPNYDVSSVIGAPECGEVLGLTTEVVLGPEE